MGQAPAALSYTASLSSSCNCLATVPWDHTPSLASMDACTPKQNKNKINLKESEHYIILKCQDQEKAWKTHIPEETNKT